MKKVFLFLIALSVLSGIYSCKKKESKLKERPAVVVDIMIAQLSDFESSVEVNGSAYSEEMVELHPEISGRLTYLNIPDGARVEKGTILAVINNADLQAQLEQQKSSLELAIKTEDRLKKLLAVNGVNQSEYDVALNQLNALHANVNVLNAQIDKTIIKAPFNGTLGLRMVSPGSYVTPQTIIGTLQQTDKIKIDFSVPETYIDLVKIGNPVTIISSENSKSFEGAISAVEPQINPETRNLKVRARLNNGSINPGAFVKVRLNKSTQRITVPSNAIIPSASSNQVILVKNNKAVFTNVETGQRNADVVELIGGINKGDSIIVSGVLFVRPNASVKIGNVVESKPELVQNTKPAE